jgi:hypothetical protein
MQGLRDQLLSGSGLTPHQDRRIIGRHALDDPKHLAHTGRLRPHAVEEHWLVGLRCCFVEQEEPARRLTGASQRQRSDLERAFGLLGWMRNHGLDGPAIGERLRERTLG